MIGNKWNPYITSEYIVDGVRESKTVDGVKHEYITLDGKIIRETYGNTTVDYFYDNEGKPYKLQVSKGNGTYTGYYVLNQQGDVIAVLNANGVKVVSYEYNAWGKVVDEASYDSITGPLFLEHNALKYRGYYYDAETGFYYVSSRYYDPVIGRFINADTTDVLTVSPISLTDKNLYAYCDNNPVMRKDDNGEFWSLAISMAIGAAVNIVATTVAASVTGQKCDGLDILAAGLSGAGMAIPGAAPWVGLGNAIYAGIRSKMKGASLGGSIFVGVTAGLCSASSFTAAAQIPNMSKVITGVVDFVFCTGFNTMTAAVYAGVISKNSTTTAKSVMKSSPKYKYNTKAKKRSKCSAMRTGCSTDYFRYLYNGGEAF